MFLLRPLFCCWHHLFCRRSQTFCFECWCTLRNYSKSVIVQVVYTTSQHSVVVKYFYPIFNIEIVLLLSLSRLLFSREFQKGVLYSKGISRSPYLSIDTWFVEKLGTAWNYSILFVERCITYGAVKLWKQKNVQIAFVSDTYYTLTHCVDTKHLK